MKKVAVLKCDNYNEENINPKIKEIFDLLGGIENLIKPNDKVFIKLNCVGPFEKEKGITTHPAVLKEVLKLVKKRTLNIIVGDNPAVRELSYTMKKNGLYTICQEEKVNIMDQKKLTVITNSNPHTFKTFEVSEEMVEADVLINLPKLKTHSLAYMTCAEKNLFGLIYGLNKSAWHTRANNPWDFGEAINDLYGAFLEKYKDKTLIHICDGIIGLEGEGPSSGGTSINSKIILASLDAVSLDRVAVEAVHLDYKKLFINEIAGKRGYGENNISNICIVGDGLEPFSDLYYLAPKDSLASFGLKVLRIKWLRIALLEHPKVNTSLCIKCGECAKICPPKAMTISKGEYPKLSSLNCIRCWCCSEVCPQNAIFKSRRPLIGSLVLKKEKKRE